MTASERSRFGDLLIEMKLVDERAVASALAEQRSTGRRLARILADRGHLEEERLAKAVGARLGLELVELREVRIHPRVLERIPGPVAVRHGVLPYAVKRGPSAEVLYLVMADPLDAAALRQAQAASSCQVRAMVAPATAIDDAIASHYGEGGAEAPPTHRPRPVSERPSSSPRASRAPSPAPRPPSNGSPRAPTSGSVERVELAARPRERPRSGLLQGPDPWASEPGKRTPTRNPGPREATLIDLPVRSRDPTLVEGGLGALARGVHRARAEVGAETLDTDRHSVREALRGPPSFEDVTVDFGDAVPGLDREGRGTEGPRTQPEELRGAEPSGATSSASFPRGLSADLVTGPLQPRLELLSKDRFLPLEVPVDFVETSHPFQGPNLSEVPVGLGETGIIPEVALGEDPFEPPPLEELPSTRWRGVGRGDIPTTPQEVIARGVEPEGSTSDDIEEIEEVHLDPLDEADVDLDDPSGELPALAEESLDVRAALAGGAATRAPSSPPRNAPVAGSEAAGRAEAERLVAALERGETLTSAERIRLVLALGRALLATGVLPRAALLEELAED